MLVDPKSTIRQLSYCQTDLAIIGHVARCCLDSGEWLIRVIDEKLLGRQAASGPQGQRDGREPHQQDQHNAESLRAVCSIVRQDLEYMRRRTVTLLSQVQQMRDRVQSQTTFVRSPCPKFHINMTADYPHQMLITITQSDAECTAAIAVDGKRDSIATKTIGILGVVFLPGTFVAIVFSINMFKWGGADSGQTSWLRVSPSIWIYWAIMIPLTVVTCLTWVLWSRRENIKSNKRFMNYRIRGLSNARGTLQRRYLVLLLVRSWYERRRTCTRTR